MCDLPGAESSYWYYSDYIVSVRPSNNRRQRALAARSPFHASHTRTHKNHKHITNGSEHYVQNEYVTHIPTSLCRNVLGGRAQTDRSSTFPCAQTDRSNTCKTNVVRVLTWRSLLECSTRHPDEFANAHTCTNRSQRYVLTCTNGSKQYVQNECCTAAARWSHRCRLGSHRCREAGPDLKSKRTSTKT